MFIFSKNKPISINAEQNASFWIMKRESHADKDKKRHVAASVQKLWKLYIYIYIAFIFIGTFS